MKHVFVITLASCCCFALFACDSKAPATAATQQSKAPPAPATIVREDSNGKLQMTVPAAWHAVDQKPGLGLVLMLMPELRRDRTRFMGFVSIYLEKSPHDVSQLNAVDAAAARAALGVGIVSGLSQAFADIKTLEASTLKVEGIDVPNIVFTGRSKDKPVNQQVKGRAISIARADRVYSIGYYDDPAEYEKQAIAFQKAVESIQFNK